jgi:flagellin-like protein
MKKIKKAISPLIATILLIVVAVALIAIVIAWGKSFTTDSLSDTDIIDTICLGAAIQVSGCNINDSNVMSFFVQNIGSTTFAQDTNFIVNITNRETLDANLNVALILTEDSLKPGQTVKFTASNPVGNPQSERYDVEVINNLCSSDAKATVKNCGK